MQVRRPLYPSLAFSLFERPLRAGGASPILSYSDKYLGGEGMVSAARELPAKLAAGLEKELREAASSIAALAGARGIWRVDFLVEPDGGSWWVNEVNTVPGSFAKYLWVGEAAVDFPRLLADMVEEARRGRACSGARWGPTGRPCDLPRRLPTNSARPRKQRRDGRWVTPRKLLNPGERVAVDVVPHWKYMARPALVLRSS